VFGGLQVLKYLVDQNLIFGIVLLELNYYYHQLLNNLPGKITSRNSISQRREFSKETTTIKGSLLTD
jgi:hypothetical protein